MFQNGAPYDQSAMEVDAPSQANGDIQAANPRKRSAPSSDEDDEEDVVDKLLPAAAAMKRRRVEEAEEDQRNGITSERSFEISQTTPKPEKARQPKKEINIKDVVRQRREAEEEAAKRDEESLRDNVDSLNVEEMKNLAVVEEMEVPHRAEESRHRAPNGGTNDRWDERWNGRKNFKKFRRQGDGTAARRGTSLIVPLEEVKKKDFGIGEDYWLEREPSKKQRKEKERATQSQSQSQPFTTARSHAAEVPPELTVDDDLPESIDVNAAKNTRHQQHTQQTEESSSTGRSLNGNRKRPAATQPSETQTVAKKQRKLAAQESDSDSEDELKFRFKKKGR